MPFCKDGLLLVLSIKGELDNAHYTAKNSRAGLRPECASGLIPARHSSRFERDGRYTADVRY